MVEKTKVFPSPSAMFHFGLLWISDRQATGWKCQWLIYPSTFYTFYIYSTNLYIWSLLSPRKVFNIFRSDAKLYVSLINKNQSLPSKQDCFLFRIWKKQTFTGLLQEIIGQTQLPAPTRISPLNDKRPVQSILHINPFDLRLAQLRLFGTKSCI